MTKMITCLWFDSGKAREAAEFYASVFPDSQVGESHASAADNPSAKAGEELIVEFTVLGQAFIGLNGGPHFQFTPAISLFVNCDTQEEVDELWDKLSEGGRKDRCGWVTDKYGLTWQIIPTALGRLMGDPDPQKAARVMNAMLQMSKIDILQLQRAYDGSAAA